MPREAQFGSIFDQSPDPRRGTGLGATGLYGSSRGKDIRELNSILLVCHGRQVGANL